MTAALLDTSVVVDLDIPEVAAALPDEFAICTITLAELSAGPLLTADLAERSRRQRRLQQVESLFDPIPFDAAAARSYGEVVAAVATAGRSHRPRVADLLIAAVAHSRGLTLYTRNGDDITGLKGVVETAVV